MSYRNKKYRALKRKGEESDSSFEKNISDDKFSGPCAGPSSPNISNIRSISQEYAIDSSERFSRYINAMQFLFIV